jgi:hypothetical protein
MVTARRSLAAVGAAVLFALSTLTVVLLATRPARPAPAAETAPALAARQQARLDRLEDLRHQRDRALGSASNAGRKAADELDRLQTVRGESLAPAGQLMRYGSDGTGDPTHWVQNGSHATKAPNSDPAATAAALAAVSSGRLRIQAPASENEIRDELLDSRILRIVVAVAEAHIITVTSLRISHPESVQDRYGNPVQSNHTYGRSADISVVDGAACKAETRGRPYRTINDNPEPEEPGPCLRLAEDLTQLEGELALGEVIFYFRAPGPGGVSLKNHDDHIHIGYRNYPSTGGHDSLPTSPNRDDLKIPGGAGSTTIQSSPSSGGVGD